MQLIVENTPFAHLLQASAEHHLHVCPRQVIGVRMGLYAGQILNLAVPQTDKRLHAFIETDGCTLDGVAVGSGCSAGRRTMHIFDFGKIAATFVDSQTEQAVRIIPHPEIRRQCAQYAPEGSDRWHAYLYAYQVMPLEEMFVVQPVRLTVSLKAIISRMNARAICDCCGEEIFNDREVRLDGKVLCQTCAGQVYYAPLLPVQTASVPEVAIH